MAIACGVLAVLTSSSLLAQDAAPVRKIAERASATLHVRGYADFLVLHNEKAWVTNEGRVELLAPNDSVPICDGAGRGAVRRDGCRLRRALGSELPR